MTLAALSPQLLHDSRLEAKLLRELGVVGPLLKEVGVEDVVLNPDNKLWCKRAGSPMAFHSMFSPAQASALLATIAHICGHTLNEDHPVLETVLPYDGSRIQRLIPPILASPSFAIRTRPTTVFTLADYVAAGILSASNRKAIEAAIAGRKNIFTVGGTGSRKTTLSNALLHSIAKLTPHHRL